MPNYSALSTAAVINANLKANNGEITHLHAFNKGAAAVYCRLYDKATAPAETDTPVWRGIIPGNTAGAGAALGFPLKMKFETGIGIRVTGGIADNDTTVLVANEVCVNVGYG